MGNSTLTLIFSGVVTLSTVIYAILTWRLTNETIKMRKAQTDPNIAIYLMPTKVSMHFLDLIIKNIGSGPAYDVTFKVLEEFDVADKMDRKLSEIAFLKEGIKYMPPNYSVETYAFQLLGQYEEIIDKSIKIEVSYKNYEKKKLSEIIHLNMSQFKGKQTLGEEPLIKIANSIESMKNNIQKISSGHTHLSVDTYTSDDRKNIIAERKKYLEEMKEKQKKSEENKSS